MQTISKKKVIWYSKWNAIILKPLGLHKKFFVWTKEDTFFIVFVVAGSFPYRLLLILQICLLLLSVYLPRILAEHYQLYAYRLCSLTNFRIAKRFPVNGHIFSLSECLLFTDAYCFVRLTIRDWLRLMFVDFMQGIWLQKVHRKV